jgi:hypothetical protein
MMHDKPAAVTQALVGRAAVQGMGGVGKTSLAIEYAHRFRGLYAGVCWCPAETRIGLLSALANLAVTLGASTAEEAGVEKAAKAALRRLAEQRATWLLVYDNAAGAQTLAEALGRLPLALDHAGAYCKRTQVQYGDYAKKASGLINAAPRGAGYPRSVAATFDIAIAEAAKQCPASEALMAYLAQCAPERIPITLVDGAIDDDAERLQALTALAEVSLLKHDPGPRGRAVLGLVP